MEQWKVFPSHAFSVHGEIVFAYHVFAKQVLGKKVPQSKRFLAQLP